jgi:hypothetical protein
MSTNLGRPSLYTEELAKQICDGLSDGQDLKSICAADGMPDPRTVRDWAMDDISGFSLRYTRARKLGFDAWTDKMRETAADRSRHPQCRKVELENERWLLSRQYPERYGDRLAHQMLDEHGKPAKAGITVIVDGATSGPEGSE